MTPAPPLEFSYDESLADNLSVLRFNVGDTNEAAPLLWDATYIGLLAANGLRLDKAELAIVQHLIVKYAQQPDQVTIPELGTQVVWRDRLSAWRERAALLRSQIAAAAGGKGGFRVSRVKRFERGRQLGDGEYDAHGGRPTRWES